MKEAVRLRHDGADDLLVTMADRTDGDAGRKIQIAVVVDIPDIRPRRMINDKRIGLRCGGRDVTGATTQKGAGLWSWRSLADMN